VSANTRVCESHVEEAALDWFEELKWSVLHGPDITYDGATPERTSYSEVILRERLESSIDSLNPRLPAEAKEEALRRVLHIDSPSLILCNRTFHKMLTDGIPVEYRREPSPRPSPNGRGRSEAEGEDAVDDPGGIIHDLVTLIDFEHLEANDWLVVNQFTVVEGQHNRRPDVVVFVNGLPLAVIELKNPADESATVETARKQFETYKAQIPSLFTTNELLIISDGEQARMGTITSPREWFLPWKTISGERVAAASKPEGEKKGGVVWHTQGAGKSLTMVFFAGKMVLHPAMRNPTIVVITDRNDLDNQLFGTFSRCSELLRQAPVQAESRADLRKKLRVASGGVVFTTIQKFFPEEKGDTHPLLSDRDNIVVIADEAHRSQYEFITGFARHIRDALPNATFIGFTGTPIELSDRNTFAVFGNTISTYDIQQAVRDKATVPIYYESRIANLDLPESLLPQIDEELEEVTEGEEVERVERLKTKWAQLEEIVGTPKRLTLVVDDLLSHFDERLSAMEGKALIVCMSRRICVEVYNEIIRDHPEWHDDDDEKGVVKVVISGSASDPTDWQIHIRSTRIRTIPSKSRLCVTCGSPASMRLACTRCTSTSR